MADESLKYNEFNKLSATAIAHAVRSSIDSANNTASLLPHLNKAVTIRQLKSLKRSALTDLPQQQEIAGSAPKIKFVIDRPCTTDCVNEYCALCYKAIKLSGKPSYKLNNANLCYDCKIELFSIDNLDKLNVVFAGKRFNCLTDKVGVSKTNVYIFVDPSTGLYIFAFVFEPQTVSILMADGKNDQTKSNKSKTYSFNRTIIQKIQSISEFDVQLTFTDFGIENIKSLIEQQDVYIDPVIAVKITVALIDKDGKPNYPEFIFQDTVFKLNKNGRDLLLKVMPKSRVTSLSDMKSNYIVIFYSNLQKNLNSSYFDIAPEIDQKKIDSFINLFKKLAFQFCEFINMTTGITKSDIKCVEYIVEYCSLLENLDFNLIEKVMTAILSKWKVGDNLRYYTMYMQEQLCSGMKQHNHEGVVHEIIFNRNSNFTTTTPKPLFNDDLPNETKCSTCQLLFTNSHSLHHHKFLSIQICTKCQEFITGGCAALYKHSLNCQVDIVCRIQNCKMKFDTVAEYHAHYKLHLPKIYDQLHMNDNQDFQKPLEKGYVRYIIAHNPGSKLTRNYYIIARVVYFGPNGEVVSSKTSKTAYIYKHLESIGISRNNLNFSTVEKISTNPDKEKIVCGIFKQYSISNDTMGFAPIGGLDEVKINILNPCDTKKPKLTLYKFNEFGEEQEEDEIEENYQE